MVSWSLVTVHTTSATALQLMRGLYDGQQRPLTSKKDTKFHMVFVWIVFSGNTNNLVRKTKSEPGVFLEFLQGALEGSRVGKVIVFIICCMDQAGLVFVGPINPNRNRPILNQSNPFLLPRLTRLTRLTQTDAFRTQRAGRFGSISQFLSSPTLRDLRAPTCPI